MGLAPAQSCAAGPRKTIKPARAHSRPKKPSHLGDIVRQRTPLRPLNWSKAQQRAPQAALCGAVFGLLFVSGSSLAFGKLKIKFYFKGTLP